jgi:hypothetical protein
MPHVDSVMTASAVIGWNILKRFRILDTLRRIWIRFDRRNVRAYCQAGIIDGGTPRLFPRVFAFSHPFTA